MLKNRIQELAASVLESTIQNRRHLHAHPELSFQEHQTVAFVSAKLDELGIAYKPMATTGLVALITGDKPSDQVVALRADMDALPIQETNEVAYKSTNAGIMHACGHDAHTASLLGTAAILQQLKADFGGTIKLIFQPAEELLPGGANQMIQEGVLENPKPQAVLGQHVMPFIETGKVGFRSGKYMASTDELYVTVKGKGGHAAQPQQNIDPVMITAQILVSLQQIVSRTANPNTPSVLSFGKVQANGATNVIPNEVKLEGTFRTMDEAWRAERKGYPFLVNEEKLTAQAKQFAEDYLGKENVLDLDIWMAAEDFAYYSQVADACFYRLGTRNEAKGITSSVHTPTFDIDENAFAISTGLMAYIALKRLGN